MSDSSKSQRSATWGCTHLGIQFRRFQIRTCRKDTVEISKLSIFQIKLKTGDERIYGQKGFAVGKFSKTRFLPLSFDHIIATMSSQTPSWFVEIKSDLATHRLFPIHQSRIFDSTPEIRNFQLALIETDMDVDLHIWMNQSSCGLPEYCNRSTSTPMTFSEHRPISWTRQVKVPRPANAGARGPEAPQRPLRRYPVSADSAVSGGARDWQSYGGARPSWNRGVPSPPPTLSPITTTAHALPSSFSSANPFPSSPSSFSAHALALARIFFALSRWIDYIGLDENSGRDGLGLGRALTAFDFRCGRCPDGSWCRSAIKTHIPAIEVDQ